MRKQWNLFLSSLSYCYNIARLLPLARYDICDLFTPHSFLGLFFLPLASSCISVFSLILILLPSSKVVRFQQTKSKSRAAPLTPHCDSELLQLPITRIKSLHASYNGNLPSPPENIDKGLDKEIEPGAGHGDVLLTASQRTGVYYDRLYSLFSFWRGCLGHLCYVANEHCSKIFHRIILLW